MKSDRIALLMVIVMFLLILFTYARFNHIEQRMTRQTMAELNSRLDSLITTIKTSDERMAGYSDSLRRIEDRLDFVEAERKDIWQKVAGMTKDLETVRAGVIAANMNANKQIVELGSISVKKADKKK
ncbi:MAG: hypothetical protein PHT59_01445 [Candidatus Omnitrophica bacterium]|nr:hypothetical protein [Candidatus Omnitrophota bacterium]